MTDKTSAKGIDRRHFMKLAGGSTLLSLASLNRLASASEATNPGAPRPKNILFLMDDQHHIDAFSALGNPHVSTPNLDKLLLSGTCFTESYCPFPICVPSRAATFSGRMPSESRSDNNSITPGMPNLGQWIHQNSGASDPLYVNRWHLPRGATQMIDGFNVFSVGYPGLGYLTDCVCARATEAFLYNTPAENPFLMVASFMQPHDICEWLRMNTLNQPELRYPVIADELPPLPDNFGFDPREPRRVSQSREGNEPFGGARHGKAGNWEELHWRYYMWSYYRHVEQIDAEIGRILDALERTGRLRDTLIVFTSDHGEGLARHQTVRKGQVYDESAKVPLVFSWPGHIPSGKRDEKTLVSGVDILPTLCDYIGTPPPPKARGKSLRGALEKNTPPDRDFIVVEFTANRGRAIRTDRFKYVTVRGDSQKQLFDMQNDPGETRNLADDPEYAEVVQHHRNLLNKWEAGLEPFDGEIFVDEA